MEEVRNVQGAVLGEMRRFDYSDDACFAVKLALEESIINAIRHGNKFDRQRLVRISFEVDSRHVSITIQDEGRGFDPQEVPDPTCDENLSKPNGRGIMLMRAYMDEVTYSKCGTKVTMVKVRA